MTETGLAAGDFPFQSSPGPGAGCCSVDSEATEPDSSLFQSSPGPGAGCCSGRRWGVSRRYRVSILTRPGGRVLHHHP